MDLSIWMLNFFEQYIIIFIFVRVLKNDKMFLFQRAFCSFVFSLKLQVQSLLYVLWIMILLLSNVQRIKIIVFKKKKWLKGN
jgi:hypothetical protein